MIPLHDIVLILRAQHTSMLDDLETFKVEGRNLDAFVRSWWRYRRLNEDIVHPALQRFAPNGSSLVVAAEERHRAVAKAIEALRISEGPAKLRRLKQARRSLNHHVAATELHLLPSLRSCSSVRRRILAKEYCIQKAALDGFVVTE